MRDIVGILLAAGAGRRFAGDKLLHRLPNGLSIAHAAARNLIAAIPRSVAVVRPESHGLARLFASEGLTVLPFALAAQGMGASLAHGVAATATASGWVIALADMPVISPETIRDIAALLRRGAVLAAPEYQGRRGHPVAFAARFRDALIALDGDTGARSVLARHSEDLQTLAVEDPGVLIDIDHAPDLGRVISARTG